jgi:hypothetical protein
MINILLLLGNEIDPAAHPFFEPANLEIRKKPLCLCVLLN